MNIDQIYDLIADTLRKHGVPCDAQPFADTIWFDDTENRKTYYLAFGECEK